MRGVVAALVAGLCLAGHVGAAAGGPTEGVEGQCRNFDSGKSTWMNMLGWLSVGVTPRWEVLDGGRTVTQYVNTPRPGFYVSDQDDIIDVVIAGTIRVNSEVDDDFVGLSVAHQGPLPGNYEFDNLLFTWGGKPAPNAYAPLKHGWATMQRINHTFPTERANDGRGQPCGHATCEEGDCMFYGGTDEQARKTNMIKTGCYTAAKTPRGEGWERFTTYTLTAMFTQDTFQVNINGVKKVSLTKQELGAWCDANVAASPVANAACKAWKKGRVAWYNHSQNGCSYGNMRMFNITSRGGSKTPVAGKDLFTLTRDAQGALQPYSAQFYDGILANDWSPDLSAFEISVANVTLSKNITKTYATSLGGSLILDGEGAFNYTPPGVVAEGKIEDTFTYALVDAKGVTSEAVNASFILTPVSLSGFSLSYAESAEMAADPTAFFTAVASGGVAGLVRANTGCGFIVDWSLTGGGSEGRFDLVPNGEYGANIIVKDPLRVRPVDREQVHILYAKATDMFGQVHIKKVIIQIPVPCLPACPAEHSTCVAGACVCDSEWGPAGKCDTLLPTTMVGSEDNVCLTTSQVSV